jgi:hypothetical protein
MKGLVATLVAGLAVVAAGGAAPAGSVPAVDVNYAVGSFYRHCMLHSCTGPDAVKVRPGTISLSADGNGFLSGLVWSTWTSTAAAASGLQSVRCFGDSTDPNCFSGRIGYTVPVEVHLSVPVSTPRGIVFTVLKVARRGHTRTVCLPRAAAC